MPRIYSETDPEACRKLWQASVPSQRITDLWEVRQCFHNHYNREFFFVVAEENGQVVGLLPLSWISEHNYYGYFPGEIWHGHTWIEQNRLIARDNDVLSAMFNFLAEKGISYHLRYLEDGSVTYLSSDSVDEIGYLFRPHEHNYDMDAYYGVFNRRSIKSIKKEVAAFEERGAAYRFHAVEDFELMVKFNCERFGDSSYFSDKKFTAGMRDLTQLLYEKGWGRMVTVLIDGVPAATDLGCIYNNVYTLFAGGTNAQFPGIAKLINLHHMKFACENKFYEADFLCGNFSWKTMFNLTPRPLYLLSNMKTSVKELC